MRSGIPMVATLNGLDACSGIRSFSGLYGNTFSNLIVNNADLLLVLGSRLGGRQVGKNHSCYTRGRVVRVDIDPHELGRVLPEALSLRSDVRRFLESMNCAFEDLTADKALPDYSPWRGQTDVWEDAYGDNVLVNGNGKNGVDPVRFVREICELLDENAILTADVGQNQMWVAQAFRVRGSQRLLNSCGHGNMGYSLPAAIGARIAAPDAQVVAFTGDGGFQMNIQELQYISCNRLDIKCVVLNNNALGMMREVQKRYFDERYYGADAKYFRSVNLEMIAKAYRLGYVLVDSHANIGGVAAAIRTQGPSIIDVRLDMDSKLLNRYDEGNLFEINRISE